MHNGSWPWSIQTGAFEARLSDFVPKIPHLFNPASHNKPFLYTAETGREEEVGAENWKRERLKKSKVNETQGFLTIWHSNWTICSLSNWFPPKFVPPCYPTSHNKPCLYTAETGREEGGMGTFTICSLSQVFQSQTILQTTEKWPGTYKIITRSFQTIFPL